MSLNTTPRGVAAAPILLVLSSLLATSALVASACFFPADVAAIEVVINKPGTTYDLQILAKLPNTVKLGDSGVAYRSHVGSDVAVIVTLQKLLPGKDAPKYLSIRIQGKYEEVNGKIKLLTNSSTLRRALVAEIKWLAHLGVIKGLGASDIAAIERVAKPGLAGWNSRIVYANGGWMPYYEAAKYIPGAALLRACAPPELPNLMKLPGSPPPSASSQDVSEDRNYYWIIAIVAGASIGIVSFLVVRKMIK